MADTHDPSQDLRTRDGETAAAGAPRPSRTGSVSKLGFDDPTLRPLPPEQLEYHAPHTDAHPERHEHSDVPIRPLAISLAAIAFILAGSFVFLYFLFFHYKGQQDALEVKRTNVPDAKPLIEGPRLQGVPGFSDKHPKDELKDQRDAYRAELESYGKTPDGFAQVPVDTAMRLAIERGMFKTAPARQDQATPATPQQQPQRSQSQQQPQQQQPPQPPQQQQPPSQQPPPQPGGAQRRQGAGQPRQSQGGGASGGAPAQPRSPQREGGVR